MLVDSSGRKFFYLRLSITDVCNFKCVYCLPNGYQCSQQRNFLSLTEIDQIIKSFAYHGIEKIRITGGEPTIRKDFIDVIRAAKDTPGINKITTTTNGFSLKSNIRSWVNAGLNSVNISIDSLNPKMFNTITGHDKFNTVMSGVYEALDCDLDSVKINSVLMKSYNSSEFDKFLTWIKHTPITLRFIELMQTRDNLKFFHRNHISGQIIKQRLLKEGWVQVKRLKTDGPAQEFTHTDYAGRIGLIMPYSNDFCSSCNRLRVTSRGDLHLCLFSEHGISLRKHMNNDGNDELITAISHYIKQKKPSHSLHEGLTGATTNLSMLGG